MEIRLDYATVNFDAQSISVDDISKALSGSENLFFKAKGLSENALLVSPFGLSYLNNSGFAPRPHRLQVSGIGCEKFAYTLPNLVSTCRSNGGECSFSRLDFAFDVVISNDQWKEFIKSAFSSSIDSERIRKKYTLAGSGLEQTIYIGSRVSDAYFRIYNKSLENPSYIYTVNGLPRNIPLDHSVIRYEIELKRHVHHRSNGDVVFDPSPLFFDYYSGEDSLIDYIKNLWLDFGDPVLLPDGFESAELHLLSKNKNFASISLQAALDVVQQNLNSEPRSFDDTIDYVVSHFGKYIPFIVSDFDLLKSCEYLCKCYCGFIPQYNLDNFYKYQFDDIDDTLSELPFEPVQLSIIPMEGG